MLHILIFCFSSAAASYDRKKRYFILRKDIRALNYYESQSDLTLLGSIPIHEDCELSVHWSKDTSGSSGHSSSGGGGGGGAADEELRTFSISWSHTLTAAAAGATDRTSPRKDICLQGLNAEDVTAWIQVLSVLKIAAPLTGKTTQGQDDWWSDMFGEVPISHSGMGTGTGMGIAPLITAAEVCLCVSLCV